MPTAVIESSESSALDTPPRKRWTRAECELLEPSGIWEQQHLELICGELISKMGKNRPHVDALTFVLGWLMEIFGKRFVNPEAPIDVAGPDNPINEPQPDVIVLARPPREIKTRNAQPADLRLVVEVSDSTLTFDLKVKAPLYARAGILEYWVVDIAGRRIIVHRDPADGAYRSIEAYSEEESVAPLAAPDRLLPVKSVFEY